MQMEEDWNGSLRQIKEVVGERNFETWIKPTRLSFEGGEYRLKVPSRLHQEWVSRHFLHTIVKALTEPGGSPPTIRVVVEHDGVKRESGDAATAPQAATRPAKDPASARRARGPVVGRLVAGYTFDHFIVGAANEVAYQAARSVALATGPSRFNPLFLWGSVGVGKTHLINAIAHQILRGSRSHRVGCLSAETFTNLMIHALKSDRMSEFRDRFRRLDVLILDDVQFLAGKDRTQEEFVHTFEALHGEGRQLVLTSDEAPRNIARLEERLRSRFEGGLIADMHPPTPEMRLAILRAKATARGVELAEDILLEISLRAGPSVRELEGALNRVLAFSSFTQHTVDRSLLDQLFGPLHSIEPSPAPNIATIQEKVAHYFGLRVEDLRSHRRDRLASQARQVAMFLCRSVGQAALTTIAQEFGGRDHTSVLYAVRTAERQQKENQDLARAINELQTTLREAALQSARSRP